MPFRNMDLEEGRYANVESKVVTSGAGIAYPSEAPEFAEVLAGFVLLDLWFSVWCIVDRCLSFFFWPLCCLSFSTDYDYPFGIFKRFVKGIN